MIRSSYHHCGRRTHAASAAIPYSLQLRNYRCQAILTLLLISIITSCTSTPKKNDSSSARTGIPGQWLILYPEHILPTKSAREAYTRATQDSIINLFGLKMIGLRSNGEFREADSVLLPPAKWMVKENGEFLIDEGGEGFRRFRGGFDGIQRDTMLISENLPLNGDTVKVIWHLKRIDDKSAKFFFNLPANWWRKKPSASEPDSVLARKVKEMLDYYAVYLSIVSKESAYFSQLRIPLPFKYYQHLMGLRPFTKDFPFNQFFYNNEDAEKAHTILATAMKKIENERFPSGKDFVIEYATYMQKLAAVIAIK